MSVVYVAVSPDFFIILKMRKILISIFGMQLECCE